MSTHERTLRGVAKLKNIDGLTRAEAFSIAIEQLLAARRSALASVAPDLREPRQRAALAFVHYLTGLELPFALASGYTSSEARELLAEASRLNTLPAETIDAIDSYLIVAVLAGAR